MRFKLMSFCAFAILFQFISSSVAVIEQEVEFCCQMGERANDEACKFDFYADPEQASDTCKKSFLYCCRQKSIKKECDEGIKAAKSNTTCQPPMSSINFQLCCSACNIVREFSYDPHKCADTDKYQISEQIQSECCLEQMKSASSTSTLDDEDEDDFEDDEKDLEDCKLGFSRQRDTPYGDCIDINECETGEHYCEHSIFCVNTEGGYNCKIPVCPEGHRFSNTTHECEDINECLEGLNNCERNENCINLKGYFICEKINCPKGYQLNYNTFECEDVDECLRRPCQARQKCINYEGYYECVCNEGYRKEYNDTNCIDIDECVEIEGICSQNCINFEGTYRCSCNKGFKLSFDNHTCDDIDECLERKNSCVGTCVNTLGSYECTCPKGFKIENEYDCKDIDECSIENICNTRETCFNTYGGHQCVRIRCDKGYLKKFNSGECALIDNMLCYKKINSEEIDFKSLNDCKIPRYYNHSFVALKRPKYMPREGRLIKIIHLNTIYDYEADIQIFHTKPLENSTMKLAMKQDFKIVKKHNKIHLKMMRLLDGPQEILLYIWIKPRHGAKIGEKVFIYTTSSSIDF